MAEFRFPVCDSLGRLDLDFPEVDEELGVFEAVVSR